MFQCCHVWLIVRCILSSGIYLWTSVGVMICQESCFLVKWSVFFFKFRLTHLYLCVPLQTHIRCATFHRHYKTELMVAVCCSCSFISFLSHFREMVSRVSARKIWCLWLGSHCCQKWHELIFSLKCDLKLFLTVWIAQITLNLTFWNPFQAASKYGPESDM